MRLTWYFDHGPPFNEMETDLVLNCMQCPDIMTTRPIKSDKAPALEGYTFEGTPSSNRNAGGAGLYLSNSIQYSVNSEYSLNELKCDDLWLNLKVNSKSKSKDDLILRVVYRYNFVSKYDQFTEKFCDILLSLNEKKKNYYIEGDFNINLMKFNLAGNVTKYMNASTLMLCIVCFDFLKLVPPPFVYRSCLFLFFFNLFICALLYLFNLLDKYP